MLRVNCNSIRILLWACLFIVGVFDNAVSAHSKPEVPNKYQVFFMHYVDKRSILDKALNLINIELRDVGRSFALIAGVSQYPNMQFGRQYLNPAQEDIQKLQDYLKAYEFFDEIVVLENKHMTIENLQYFLQTYFPKRLKKFPKSRFLFAYSGHGMTEWPKGYILKSTAQNLKDKDNSIDLDVVRVFVDDLVSSGHHVLVLLNACYSGAFLRRPFGTPKRLIPRHRGAHAITAGGTGELTFHIPKVGKGSVFFEKVFAGLDGHADSSEDGVITVYELFSYVQQEVQIFTDQYQNPQVGDLSPHRSKGQFFFLNRDRQVAKGVLPEWKPERATPLGIRAEELLLKGDEYYSAGNYQSALNYYRQSADAGNNNAKVSLGYLYDLGLGVTKNHVEAHKWYRKAAEEGSLEAMYNLGGMYTEGRGVARDMNEALHWFRRAAEGGYARAMSNLGRAYDDGIGVLEDDTKAFHWYRKAAEAGYAEAMNSLGFSYNYGEGVAKNYTQALYWYRKAAKAGLPMGMYNIGTMYENGKGVAKNYTQALYWYRKAAKAGSEHAIKRLNKLGEQIE